MGTIRDDVVSILAGFGSVRVVHSTGATRGKLDDGEAEQQLGDGSTVAKRGRVLRIPAAALPNLVAEETLEVGDVDDDDALTTYRILDTLREGDGLVWRLFLA